MARTKAPVRYSPRIVEIICREMAQGTTLEDVCKRSGFPTTRSVRRWVRQYPEFHEKYRAAQMLGWEFKLDEIVNIARSNGKDFVRNEDGVYARDEETGELIPCRNHIFRDRLVVDTMKWALAKMVPKIFGDRTQVDLSGEVGVKARTDEQILTQITGILTNEVVFEKVIEPLDADQAQAMIVALEAKINVESGQPVH